jgi:hypothetical protein
MPPPGASASSRAAIAVEIVAIHDQVAEVQADAKDDGGFRRLVPIGFSHCLLELDGRAKRIHGAAELDQSTVARQLDQPAAVTSQCRLQTLLPVASQARKRAALIPTHQAGIADHVR